MSIATVQPLTCWEETGRGVGGLFVCFQQYMYELLSIQRQALPTLMGGGCEIFRTARCGEFTGRFLLPQRLSTAPKGRVCVLSLLQCLSITRADFCEAVVRNTLQVRPRYAVGKDLQSEAMTFWFRAEMWYRGQKSCRLGLR